MKKFLILLSSAFILFVGMNKVKAYTTGVDTGAPYFYTDGTVDSEGSNFVDLSSYSVGGFDYGCNNTFTGGYSVEQAVNPQNSSYCYYLLKNGNQYFIGINSMEYYNNNEPQSVFMSFTVPPNWNFATVSSSGYYSVILFHGDFELTHSGSSWTITNTDNTSNMLYKYMRVNERTPYQPTRYYSGSVMFAPSQYVSGLDGINGSFSNIYFNGLEGANSSYAYYSDTSISWNTQNGSQDFPRSVPSKIS